MLFHCIAHPQDTSLVHLCTPTNKQITKQLYCCVNHVTETTCYKLQSNVSNMDNEGTEQNQYINLLSSRLFQTSKERKIEKLGSSSLLVMFMSVHQSVQLSVHLFVSVRPSVHLSVNQSVIPQQVCLFTCVIVCSFSQSSFHQVWLVVMTSLSLEI